MSFSVKNFINNIYPQIAILNENVNNLDATTFNLSSGLENIDYRSRICYLPLLWNEKLQIWLSNVNPSQELNILNSDLPPTKTSRFFYIFSMWYFQLHLTLVKLSSKNIFPSWFSYSLPSLPDNISDDPINLVMNGCFQLMLKINQEVTGNTVNVPSITDFYNSCLTQDVSALGESWIISQTNSYWSQLQSDYSPNSTNSTWNSVYTPSVSPVNGEWRPLDIPNGTYLNSWNIPWPNGPGTFSTQNYATPNWGGVIGYEWHRTASTGTNITGFPIEIQNTLNNQETELNEPALANHMKQVLDLNGNLTPRDKFIAEFWEDGYSTAKPCGKWNFLTRLFIRTLGMSIDQAIELLFLVNAALVNAFIVAWDVKRIYADKGERPVTYLRRTVDTSFNGWRGDTEKGGLIDPTDHTQGFLPYQDPKFITPPFPGFISGHSTCSAAAGTMLSLYIGKNTIPNIMLPDSTYFTKESNIHMLNEVKSGFAPYLEYDTAKYSQVFLSFRTFDEMIESAGWSRLYGGIHILPDHTAAVEIGKYLANYTFDAYKNK
jgi:hypothetical protein